MFGSNDDEESAQSDDDRSDSTEAGDTADNGDATRVEVDGQTGPTGGREGHAAETRQAERDSDSTQKDTDPTDADGREPEPAATSDLRDRQAEVIDRLQQIEARTAERIEDLETEVRANRERIDDLESGLADHRRRSEAEREEIREYAVEQFAQEMVQVKDSLETAIEVEDIDDSTAERLELLNKEFAQALTKGNVEPIDDPAEEFDALRHRIISKEPSPAHDSNEIVEVAEPGYAMGDRVLRPARVILAV